MPQKTKNNSNHTEQKGQGGQKKLVSNSSPSGAGSGEILRKYPCEIVIYKKSTCKKKPKWVRKTASFYNLFEFELKKNMGGISKHAKRIIRRAIETYDLYVSITLTFEKYVPIEEAKKHLKKFLDRAEKYFKRRGKVFRCVAVMELQTRGVVHFHLAVNQFIDKELLDKWWGKGTTKINGPPKGTNSRNLLRRIVNYKSKGINLKKIGEEMKDLQNEGDLFGMKWILSEFFSKSNRGVIQRNAKVKPEEEFEIGDTFDIDSYAKSKGIKIKRVFSNEYATMFKIKKKLPRWIYKKILRKSYHGGI